MKPWFGMAAVNVENFTWAYSLFYVERDNAGDQEQPNYEVRWSSQTLLYSGLISLRCKVDIAA